jgi:hypothetical protein
MTDAAAIVGTWKMISWTRQNVETGEVSDAMGPHPIGYIAYHADGRMMATVFRRGRVRLAGASPTDEEKVSLFDSMLAYCAAYSLEDGKVIHHVEGAWNPAWEIDLVRPFTLDGDRLVISNAPGKDMLSGENVIFRLEFQKL